MRKRRREKSARLPFGKLRKPLRHMRCEETTSQLVTSPVQKQLRSTPADQLSLALSGLFARRYCLSNPIQGTKEEDRVVVYRNFNLTELMKQLELRQVAEVELLRQMTLSISCNLTSGELGPPSLRNKFLALLSRNVMVISHQIFQFYSRNCYQYRKENGSLLQTEKALVLFRADNDRRGIWSVSGFSSSWPRYSTASNLDGNHPQ